MKEARFYERTDGQSIRCRLCAHGCLIRPGKRGFCGVRENRAGRLVSRVYARPVAQAVDPVEKKPLYHVLPGTHAFSIGTRGCNFRCLHCQNCDISQVSEHVDMSVDSLFSPEQIVDKAVASGSRSIAYTYTEPTIFYEYAFDTASLAHEQGLKNIFVTNGYLSEEPLRRIAPVLDAANIDLKFFRDELYRKVCSARLEPVLDTIRLARELGIWIEVTTLVIPGYNDDRAQLEDIAGFVAGVSADMPWHISAFYPTFKLTDAEPTPPSALERARKTGEQAGLRYVYLGNVAGVSDTYCPGCGAAVIERSRMGIGASRLADGRCATCGAEVAGVWA